MIVLVKKIEDNSYNSKKFKINPVNDYVWNNKLYEIFVYVRTYIYQEHRNYYKAIFIK